MQAHVARSEQDRDALEGREIGVLLDGLGAYGPVDAHRDAMAAIENPEAPGLRGLVAESEAHR
jgi:hypothetical protein